MIYEVHWLRKLGSSRRWVLALATAFSHDALRRASDLIAAGCEVRVRPVGREGRGGEIRGR